MAAVTYRPAGDDDVASLVTLFNAGNVHDGVLEAVQEDELAEELSNERTSLADDTIVAVDADELVGVAYTVHIPSTTVHERCFIDGTVAPTHRGRGIGRTLMAWAVAHATELLRASDTGLPRCLEVHCDERRAADQRLLARLGFSPVRWFEELLRPLDPPLDGLDLGDVSIVPWPVDRDQELRQVRNASFADHWGSTPVSEETWQRHVHGFGSRLDLSHAAIDRDGTIVAICHATRFEADDALTGRRDGWIATLGTLAGWRGRGIASALIGASLRAFSDAGLTHAALGVDSASPTGAARLYKSLGFEPFERSMAWRREVES